jgi:hypothetical protein
MPTIVPEPSNPIGARGRWGLRTATPAWVRADADRGQAACARSSRDSATSRDVARRYFFR